MPNAAEVACYRVGVRLGQVEVLLSRCSRACGEDGELVHAVTFGLDRLRESVAILRNASGTEGHPFDELTRRVEVAVSRWISCGPGDVEEDELRAFARQAGGMLAGVIGGDATAGGLGRDWYELGRYLAGGESDDSGGWSRPVSRRGPPVRVWPTTGGPGELIESVGATTADVLPPLSAVECDSLAQHGWPPEVIDVWASVEKGLLSLLPRVAAVAEQATPVAQDGQETVTDSRSGYLGLTLDDGRKIILRDGKSYRVKMRRLLWGLLKIFVARGERYVTRIELEDEWEGLGGGKLHDKSNAIYASLSELRSHLKATGFTITNCPNVGWRLEEIAPG